MLAIAVIAFREFLEAFLLIGVFIGIDRKLRLGKQKEILLAVILGISLSLLLPIIVFFFASDIKSVVTEERTDIVEGYFLTFSGFFLAYVIFSLHSFMRNHRNTVLANASRKMEQNIFDISLVLTLILFIAREGFEIALLVATTSIFSVFWKNIAGLLVGFSVAAVVGLSTFFAYIKLPIKKIFSYTEYFIILIGAAMVKNGMSILLESYTHIHIEKILPLPMGFMPSDTTVLGHLLKNLFGLQQHTSIVQLIIMGVYIFIIYYFFFTRNKGKVTYTTS